jgi:hypothetical protein
MKKTISYIAGIMLVAIALTSCEKGEIESELYNSADLTHELADSKQEAKQEAKLCTTGVFELKNNNGSYHFTLKAKNGQVILSSEVYNSKAGAKNGISSVRKNSCEDGKFDRKISKNNKFYFNLKAGNGQVIGTSQMYVSKQGMENGIRSVRENAPRARIEEVIVQ